MSRKYDSDKGTDVFLCLKPGGTYKCSYIHTYMSIYLCVNLPLAIMHPGVCAEHKCGVPGPVAHMPALQPNGNGFIGQGFGQLQKQSGMT